MAEAQLPRTKRKGAAPESQKDLLQKLDDLQIEDHSLKPLEGEVEHPTPQPEENIYSSISDGVNRPVPQREESIYSSISEEPVYESVYDESVVNRPETVEEVCENETENPPAVSEDGHNAASKTVNESSDANAAEAPQVEMAGDTENREEEPYYNTLWPADPIPEVHSGKQSDYDVVRKPRLAVPPPPVKTVTPVDPKPLTTAQLKTLYFNEHLERLDQNIHRFMMEANTGNPQFFDLLQSYLRALLKQRHSEECLDLLRKDSQRLAGLVWQREVITGQVKARCADNQIVEINYESQIAQLNETYHTELEENLRAIQSLLSEDLSTHGYSCQLAKLEIELFIFRLYMEAPLLRDMPRNLPPRVLLTPLAPPDRVQLERLKQCLSSLFAFHRKPITDEQFLNDLRQWTVKLGGSLIRVGDSESHQFLLNHLLRCPSGIHKWATSLVQPVLPALEETRLLFQDELFDHTIAMIGLLLRPIQGREEFVRPMKTLLVPMTEGLSSQSKPKDPNWVLVDSDGETDDDSADSWYKLHENDLVALFAQMPIDAVFRHVLSITTDPSNGEDFYQPGLPAMCTPAGVLRIMSFVSQVLAVFEGGLKTYSVGRYKQLNKRLGRLVKHAVQFMTDHWESVGLMMKAVGQGDQVPQLQVQYETIFIQAVEILLHSNKLGSWQYLADFPYRLLSPSKKTYVLRMFTHGTDMSALEEKIPNLPTAECIYLMTTLSNLGRDCDLSQVDERELVDEIVDGIFRLSFVCEHTRHLCVKVGRELLTGMALKHSYIIASVVDHTKNSMRDIEKVGIYLFKELPFHLYVPNIAHIALLQSWLVGHRIDSVESHLARVVLSGMNWSGNPQGASLDIDLHHTVGLMLVEAFASHTNTKTWTTVVGDSARHLSSLLYITGPSQETTFFAWCVHLITRLRVHRASWQNLRHDQAGRTIDIRSGGRWQPIMNGIKVNNPLALYLAAAMMPYCDNSPGGFLDASVEYLLMLSKQSHYRLVIEGVRHIAMLSFCHTDFLISSNRFQQIVLSLLRADQSYFQTFKKLLSDDFPGVLLSAAIIMILDLCENVPSSSGFDCSAMLSFWLRVLTQIPNFQNDRQCSYAIEKLLEYSFTKYTASVIEGNEGVTDVAEIVMKEVYQQYTDLSIQAAKKRKGLSALINMGASFVPLYSESMAKEFPYLCYYLLKGHQEMENRLKIWHKLQEKTADFKMRGRVKQPVDILPDVIKALDFPLNFTATSLSIYMWGNLMGQLTNAHPLHPLINSVCQQFFLRFFDRKSGWSGSLGLHYFESRTMTTLLKSWRGSVRGAQNALSEKYNETTSDASVAPNEMLMVRSNVCGAMSLWLDEPRLHDNSLQLPALPPQYDSERLAGIFSGYEYLWIDSLRVSDLIDPGLNNRLQRWHRRHETDRSLEALGRPSLQERQTPSERIISRLKRQMRFVPPPPMQQLQPPVQSIGLDVLTDKRLLLHSLNESLNLLITQAQFFVTKYDQMVALDIQYHDGLSSLMVNKTVEKAVEGNCVRRIGNVRGCSGPATAKVRCQQCTEDETIRRQLEGNRVEYHQLVLEGSIPPPQTLMLAALFVDNAIDSIIAVARSQSEPMHTRVSAIDCGVTLFYHMAGLVSDSTKTFPPTRHFVAATLEKLGNEFISGNPSQVGPLLDELLKTPHLVELLSPHFSPLANTSEFVGLYGRLVQVPAEQQSDVIFSLLTKFDVREWLPSSPGVDERNRLINHICSGLRSCGAKPSQKCTLLFEVFKSHLSLALHYDITAHLGYAMKECLQLAAADQLCPSIWTQFVSTLKAKTENSGELSMSIELIQNLLDEQNRVFASHRQKCVRWGLFSHWGKHSDNLVQILVILLDNLALKLSRSSANQHMESQQALDITWSVTLSVFKPWLAPEIMGNVVGVPWLPEEKDMANVVMQQLCKYLVSLNDRLIGILKQWTASLILQRLWFFFSKELMKTPEVPQHLVDVYVSALVDVKLWTNWIVDTTVLRDMNDMVRGRPNCMTTRHFILLILSRVDWGQMQQPGMPLIEEQEFSNFLFNLVMCALGGKEAEELLKSEVAQSLLEQVIKISWLTLNATTYDGAVRWLVSQAGAVRFILHDSIAPEGKLMKLITAAAGVGSPGTSSFMLELWQQPAGSPAQATIFNQLNKQILCIRAQIQLFQQLGSASHNAEFVPERYATSLVNLLTEAEGTLADIPNSEPRMNHGVLVADECLNLLRNCTPARIRHTLTVFKEWFASSGSSPLLLPLLRCAASNPPSLHSTAVLAEEAILAYINAPQNDGTIQAWNVLSSCMSVPASKSSDLMREAASSSCLLCLFLYNFQQQQQCGPNPSRDVSMTQTTRILEWMSHFILRPEDELKCILLWDRLLECLIKLSSNHPNDNQAVRFLNNWIPHLSAWAEDKTSTGVLGMIGLGKRSVLSTEFRFLCRAMIAYILAQLPANHSLRAEPNAAGHLKPEMVISSRPLGVVLPTNQALTAVRTFRQLKSNKTYQHLASWIPWTLDYIGQPENSLLNSRTLLAKLTSEIYRGEKLLAIIQT